MYFSIFTTPFPTCIHNYKFLNTFYCLNYTCKQAETTGNASVVVKECNEHRIQWAGNYVWH
jgi:hypothetical protein